MLSMFALVVSGFAAELSQLDALVSWARLLTHRVGG